MIAVAAVAMGFVANAAVCKWTVSEAYQPGGSTAPEGWAVYFFDVNDYSYSSAETALAKGDLSFLANQSGSAVRYIDEEASATGQTKKDTYAAKEPINGYLVILNDGDIKSATLAYLQDGSTTMPDMDGSAGKMAFGKITGMKDSGTVTSGNGWYSMSAVPEPTSGLLLLIGVAGLALRRRRA